MIRILVTGASGQLGMSIQKITSDYPKLDFVFKNSKELDITDDTMLKKAFETGHYRYCINCAAYTNVEKAESEEEKAFAVNALGVRNLALHCSKNEVTLIHISTDYVFDGEKKSAYGVKDVPNPINVYGASKLKGELYIQKILTRYLIIRTSWLYSEFGKNFYKTITERARTEKVLKITDEQLGCPTRAGSLAKFVLGLIDSHSTDFGIHHFTDGEAMTWYDFAQRILRQTQLTDAVRLEKSKNYRTLAKRPRNSVLLNNRG